MGFYDFVNYVIYDNPVCSTVTSLVKNNLPIQRTVTVITEPLPLWRLAEESGPLVKVAGLMGASAVALGAYGAHISYPKDREDELKAIYQTANRFHFYNSLAMLGIPLCKNARLSGALIFVGTVLFSGACYYHAFTGSNKFGKVAPVGGTMMIIGWLVVFI